jgi:hypothetical protein
MTTQRATIHFTFEAWVRNAGGGYGFAGTLKLSALPNVGHVIVFPDGDEHVVELVKHLASKPRDKRAPRVELYLK